MKYLLTLLLLGIGMQFSNAACFDTTLMKKLLEERNTEALKNAIEENRYCDNCKECLGTLYHYLGASYYRKDPNKAIYYTLIARDFRKTNLTADYGVSNHNLGAFYERLNRLDSAAHYFKQATEVYDQLDTIKIIGSTAALAKVMRKKGEYEKAIHYLNITIEKARRFDSKYDLCVALNELGVVSGQVGDYDNGISNASRAINCYGGFSETQYQYEKRNALFSLANNYFGLRAYVKALKYYSKIYRLAESHEDEEMKADCAMNMGICFKKLKNYPKALEAFQQAFEIKKTFNNNFDLANFYHNIADVYLLQKDFDGAIDYYFQSIAIVLPDLGKEASLDGITSTMLRDASNKTTLVTRIKNYGNAFQVYYKHTNAEAHLLEALKAYRLADQVMDYMRREHSMEASKLFWRKQARPIYEAALSVCHALEDYEKAFYFLEKSKSILLLDALTEDKARSVIPWVEVEQEKKLQQELEQAARALEKARQKDSDTKLEAAERLLEAQERLEDFVGQLEQKYPKYVTLKYGNEVTSLSETQKQLLQNGTVLLSYFYGDNDLYVLKINEEEVLSFEKIQRNDTLEQGVKAFIAQFENSKSRRNTRIEDYKTAAHHLFQLVYAPVFKATEEKVIIIPDGPLSFIPFEAMLSSQEGKSFGNLDYLLLQQQICQAYSASVLSKQQGRLRNDYLALHVAPGFENDPLGRASLQAMNTDGLENLGHFQKNLNKEATLKAFIQAAEKSNIINLFTHAEALDGASPKIEFIDTALYLSQLYTLDIPADLVVLGACQTSMGKVAEGEGVMSLARGFAHAGAQSLVASLWRVNDKDTGDLLARFYDKLGEGQSKASALRKAKIDFLKQKDRIVLPAQWSGLVFIGNGAPLKNSPYNPWPFVLGGVLLFGMIWTIKK